MPAASPKVFISYSHEKGADWEGQLITTEIYRAKSRTAKFLPVVFESRDKDNLGNLNRDQNRLDEARRNLEEALKIYESPAIKIIGKQQFILDAADMKRQLETLPSKKGS